jgi:uncharacterized protein YjbJ (UPF0337 family)
MHVGKPKFRPNPASARDLLQGPRSIRIDVASISSVIPTSTQHGLQREFHMSNASKRGEGKAEEIGGKIKGGVGKVIGNEQMQAEGKAHELQGKAKQEAAKGAERTKGKVQEVAGAAKNRVGALIDDDELEAEGKAKELEGEARQKTNR